MNIFTASLLPRAPASCAYRCHATKRQPDQERRRLFCLRQHSMTGSRLSAPPAPERPTRQGIDEAVQLRIRKCPVDVAVALGQLAVEVVSAEQDFHGATAPQQARQPGHRTASRHKTGPDLEL